MLANYEMKPDNLLPPLFIDVWILERRLSMKWRVENVYWKYICLKLRKPKKKIYTSGYRSMLKSKKKKNKKEKQKKNKMATALKVVSDTPSPVWFCKWLAI